VSSWLSFLVLRGFPGETHHGLGSCCFPVLSENPKMNSRGGAEGAETDGDWFKNSFTSVKLSPRSPRLRVKFLPYYSEVRRGQTKLNGRPPAKSPCLELQGELFRRSQCQWQPVMACPQATEKDCDQRCTARNSDDSQASSKEARPTLFTQIREEPNLLGRTPPRIGLDGTDSLPRPLEPRPSDLHPHGLRSPFEVWICLRPVLGRTVSRNRANKRDHRDFPGALGSRTVS